MPTTATNQNGENNMSAMDNIREIVRLASTNHGFISIKSYESGGSGQVADFLVQPLGENGYANLLEKSIVEAKKLERPSKFDEELWNKALTAQIASWEKTLGEGHDRKDNYSKGEKAFYGHEDNDAVYIRNFVIVKKTVTTEGEFKTVKSRPLTICKKHIRKNVSLSKYQANLKLEIGKFASVKYNGVTISGK